MFRPSETIEVSVEETHHHVLQLVYGTRNLETGTVFHTRRSERPRTSEENIERVRQAFQRSPMKSIRTAATTFNSAQSPIVCLQSANVTRTSAKRHAKTKRICIVHAATNF